MLKVSYEILRDKGKKLGVTVVESGVRLDFYNETAPKTWLCKFSVVMNEGNFPSFHDQYTRLVYGAGDIYSLDYAILGGVQNSEVSERLRIVIRHSFLDMYRMEILGDSGHIYYEFRIRKSELINLMDETQTLLRNIQNR